MCEGSPTELTNAVAVQNEQDNVRLSIDQVRNRREAAVAARDAAQSHSRQLQQRVSQAGSLLNTLQSAPEHVGASILPPPAAPSKRFSMEDLALSGPEMFGPTTCNSIQQLLAQEASSQGKEVADLAATTGFDVHSLPGSVRVVEFCNSPYSLLDHVFLYIHQGVHIHCLISRLRDAHALLAACEDEPAAPQHTHCPAPFKRRCDPPLSCCGPLPLLFLSFATAARDLRRSALAPPRLSALTS